ncbi:MAG: peptidoglycan DD-metalloendopeptidase family protein [Anaerolineaceae bacterium]
MSENQNIPVDPDLEKTEFESAIVNEPSETSPTLPWYRQPGYLIALSLVIVALVLLSFWIANPGKSTTGKETFTPSKTLTVYSPIVNHTEPTRPSPNQMTPTIEPTEIPTPMPRSEVITYTMMEGETLYSVADKFNLSPETIYWGNFNLSGMGSDPKDFVPGRTIYILPTDGVYYEWHTGDGLNGVSEYFGVTPDDIIDYPTNRLNRAELGDLSLPNIKPGTLLVIPGGTRPETLTADGLLTYAARAFLRTLPEVNSSENSNPRENIVYYVTQAGDTLFTIAEKFSLTPETVLWSNRYLIGDTPDGIFTGQKLFILPEDGVIHGWIKGESMDVVSDFYRVEREAIYAEPLNNITPTALTDPIHPNIRQGTMLFVPGGTRPPVTWASPVSATDNGVGNHPNVSYLGIFACNSTAWQVGTGSWQFPTTEHWISGYEFTPPTHNGLDYAGRSGFRLFAADSGVIIYAGWSSRGYGNTVVIDHGNGYLTLYGHLLDDGFVKNCGDPVDAGELIGYMGSTGLSSGPHLHFEVKYNGSAVNPHDLGL